MFLKFLSRTNELQQIPNFDVSQKASFSISMPSTNCASKSVQITTGLYLLLILLFFFLYLYLYLSCFFSSLQLKIQDFLDMKYFKKNSEILGIEGKYSNDNPKSKFGNYSLEKFIFLNTLAFNNLSKRNSIQMPAN